MKRRPVDPDGNADGGYTLTAITGSSGLSARSDSTSSPAPFIAGSRISASIPTCVTHGSCTIGVVAEGRDEMHEELLHSG